MKIKLLLLAVLVLAALTTMNTPQAKASTTTYTFYCRNNTHTINNVTGYILNGTQSSSEVSVEETYGSLQQVEWGWRVWVVQSDNSSTEITSGSPVAVVLRNLLGAGLQYATWKPSVTEFYVGWTSLKVIAYTRFNVSAWVPLATFTSSRIVEKTLLNSTWTFYAYTNRTTYASTTYSRFHWGVSSRNTRVIDVQFTDADTFETMIYYLQNQDFISFVMYPYINRINTLAYGLFLLIPTVTTYNRYHSIQPMLIALILFSGVGGVFTMLIPEAGLALMWVVCVFALGGLLYTVFR